MHFHSTFLSLLEDFYPDLYDSLLDFYLCTVAFVDGLEGFGNSPLKHSFPR